MRVTVFTTADGEHVDGRVTDEPAWEPFDEWEGQPLDGVRRYDIRRPPGPEIQLVELAVGGHFVMHSSPDIAFCQVLAGRGILRLPGPTDLAYAAPELYVFEPHTLHEWRDITERTQLSVCIVPTAGS